MAQNRKRALIQKGPVSTVDDLVKAYSARRPVQQEFTAKLVELFRSLLHVQNIDFHMIECRTKDVDSFKEKIGRASKAYVDPLNEITDLSGIRIITYYDEDVDIIGQLIQEEFDVDATISVDKRAGMRPEEFGYQSVHYVLKLSAGRSSLLEWRHLADLQAEIQVRTVLQHAWAAISHKLQYKREADVPTSLRRKLFRLSALLELADEQFLTIRDETATLSQVIEEKLATGQTDLDINQLTLEEFLRISPDVARFVEQAHGAGFELEMYQHGIIDEGPYISAISAFADHLKIKTISELENMLHDAAEWSDAYFNAQKSKVNARWEASPAFLCLLILIGIREGEITQRYLIANGWSPDTAARVLRVARTFSQVRK